MRNTITLIITISLLCISCYTLKSTIVDLPDTVRIVEVNESKNDLFVKANNWMVEAFADAKSVIQFSDKENGIVTGKYLMNPQYVTLNGMNATSIPDIYAIIKIQVKDGASKITINPSQFEQYDTQNKTLRESYFSKDKAQQKINELVNSFTAFMKQKRDDF